MVGSNTPYKKLNLSRIVATTTKICTNGCSTQDHSISFFATITPSYKPAKHTLVAWDRFSALAPSIFRANPFGR